MLVMKSFFYWLTKIMKLNIKAKKLYIILIALLNFGLCAAHTGIAHADEIDENAWYVSKSMNAPALYHRIVSDCMDRIMMESKLLRHLA